jgi:hypothetical protein
MKNPRLGRGMFISAFWGDSVEKSAKLPGFTLAILVKTLYTIMQLESELAFSGSPSGIYTKRRILHENLLCS